MITYRELAASDYPDLGRYYAETFNTPPWDETWTAYDAEARLRQLMDCYKPYGLLALLDGELAGMIIGGEEQDSTGRLFNIKEFFVRNDLRHHGIGSQLFTELENRMRARGIDILFFFTLADEDTQRFYARLGVERLDTMAMMMKKL